MGKAHDLKMFTVEEANRLIPQLTEWLGEIRMDRDRILAMEVEIDALELVSEKRSDSGISQGLAPKVEEYTTLVDRFYSRVDNIHSTGCLVKDLDLGLVDFYSLQNNRVIFLCWKLGEPAISFWHDISSGYASRQKFGDS